MKHSKYLLLIASLFLGLGCQQQNPKTKTPPLNLTQEKTTGKYVSQMEMTIDGMMCAIGCAATIEKKLNATSGIGSATVDFESKKAWIVFDRMQINPQQITAVVTGVGEAYSVKEIKVKK